MCSRPARSSATDTSSTWSPRSSTTVMSELDTSDATLPMTRLTLSSVGTSPPTRPTSTTTCSVKHSRTRMIFCGRGLKSVSVAATARHNMFIQKVSHVCRGRSVFPNMKSLPLLPFAHRLWSRRQTRDSCWTARETFVPGRCCPRSQATKWARHGRSQTGRGSFQCTLTSSFRVQRACLVLECFRHTQGEL